MIVVFTVQPVGLPQTSVEKVQCQRDCRVEPDNDNEFADDDDEVPDNDNEFADDDDEVPDNDNEFADDDNEVPENDDEESANDKFFITK